MPKKYDLSTPLADRLAIAATGPEFWQVAATRAPYRDGKCWWYIVKGTSRRMIGPVKITGKNYYDEARDIADRRNAKQARR